MKSTILKCLAYCGQRGLSTTLEAISHQCGEDVSSVSSALSELQIAGQVEFRDNTYHLVSASTTPAPSEPEPEVEVEVVEEPVVEEPPEPEPEPVVEPDPVSPDPVSPEPHVERVVVEKTQPEPEPPSDSRSAIAPTDYQHASLGDYVLSLNHEVTEVRILRERPHLNGRWVGRQLYGYFDSPSAIEEAIAPYLHDPDTSGIYTTLQSCHPDLLTRCMNRLKTAGTNDATKDHEITSLSVFPIDVDGTRPYGISASKSEILESKQLADEIRKWFAERGIEMMLALSGNGWHLLCYLNDTPATEDNLNLLKSAGDRVAKKWETDETIYNASRIWKLYGTWARKGDSTPDRQHRLARIQLPASINDIPRYDFGKLVKVINELPAPDNGGDTPPQTPRRTPPNGTQRRQNTRQGVYSNGGKRIPQIESKEDLEAFAREWGVTPSDGRGWKQRRDGWWGLRVNCPQCGGKDYALLAFAELTGKWSYSCSGNTCKRNGTNAQMLYQKAGYAKSEWRPHSDSEKKEMNAIEKKRWFAQRGLNTELPPISEWELVENGGDSYCYRIEGIPCKTHGDPCTMTVEIPVSGIMVEAAEVSCDTTFEEIENVKEKDSEPPF